MRRHQPRKSHVESLEPRVLLSDWYVSTTGNDLADGTLSSPWRTIQHAVDVALSGDDVYLRGGVYTEEVRITRGGLTLSGYATENAHVTTPIDSLSQATIHIGEDASNTRLTNLEISGGAYYAVKTESTWDTGVPDPHGPSYVTIDNCRIHDSGADVIKLTPATNYTTIESCEIYNSGRRDPSNAEGIDAVQANYATVRNCYIHDITTNGVYFKGGSVQTLFERNRIAHVGFSGIILGQQTDPEWFDPRVNPDYYESIDGIVRNNIIWDAQAAGIAAWAALRPQVYNNTLYNVARTLFAGLAIVGQEHWVPNEVWTPSRDASMYNNIVSVGGERPVLVIRDGGIAGSLTLSNNCYDRGVAAAVFRDFTRGFEGTLAEWQALGMDSNSLDADPLLDLLTYNIPSASPAVDHGIVSPTTVDFFGNARPAGTAYDIGASEYQPSGIVLSAPTGFTASAGGPHSITLSWTNTAPQATGVLIETATDPEFRFDVTSQSVSASTSSLPLSGLLSNVRYYFRIRATRDGAMSPAAAANAMTSVSSSGPAMPTPATVLSASNRGVSLSWTYPAPGSIGGVATGFLIERTRTAGAITYYQRYSSTETSFVDVAVEPDVTYEYRIRAVNDLGWSDATAATPAVTTTIPNQPPQISSPASATDVIVTDSSTDLFVLGSDDEGESALRYGWSVISRPAGASDPVFTENGTNAAKHTRVTFGMVGNYLLRAYILDSAKLFVTSDLAITVIGATAPIPQPPSAFAALMAGPNQIYLSWTQPLPIPVSFTLQRSTTPDFSQDLTTVRLAGATTYFLSGGLSANVTCYFRMASTSNGLSSGWVYASASTLRVLTIPETPVSVSATRISSSQVQIAWSMPAPGMYAHAPTGFLVERSPVSDFTAGVVRFRVAGGETRSFVDPKVKPGIAYYYRVRAVTSTEWSDASAVAPAAATLGAQIALSKGKLLSTWWDQVVLA